MAPIPTDPIEQQLAADAARDHARAAARGQRVRELTNLIIGALDGHGCLWDADKARVIVYGALVDGMYGNNPVDVDPRPW